MDLPSFEDTRIAVIGLGYVGLPLAVAFARHFPTLGFDTKETRITELREGRDSTREVSGKELAAVAGSLTFTGDQATLADANVFIITVPTPVDSHKRPDFGPLIAASRTVGARLSPGDVVIYESTVYPGATEEICVGELEVASGLKLGRDFAVGYSPERINPGDREHRLETIVKITSGSDPHTARFVDQLYRRIVTAGTHPAPSIRVAEAAKVIENTQRDLNIALVNELARIFHRLRIDTLDVLEAAGTKWNFLPFRPGLVGGHCIGVDPYYLTYKAQEVGHHPEIILAGRRINDSMGRYLATEIVKLMNRKKILTSGSRVLVLGLAFKENTPDLRNTKVIDLVRELEEFGAQVTVHDPWVDPDEARGEYGIELASEPGSDHDAVVLAVAHREFRAMAPQDIRALGREGAVFYDIKSAWPRDLVDARL